MNFDEFKKQLMQDIPDQINSESLSTKVCKFFISPCF